jgi:hypothetical protein
MAKVFNVETTFEGMVMIHAISERVTVSTNLSTLISILYKDGIEINRTDCSGMTLADYGKYLMKISEHTETANV